MFSVEKKHRQTFSGICRNSRLDPVQKCLAAQENLCLRRLKPCPPQRAFVKPSSNSMKSYYPQDRATILCLGTWGER